MRSEADDHVLSDAAEPGEFSAVEIGPFSSGASTSVREKVPITEPSLGAME